MSFDNQIVCTFQPASHYCNAFKLTRKKVTLMCKSDVSRDKLFDF